MPATEAAILRGAPLPQSFFDRNAEEVARDLLGAILVSSLGGDGVTAGRIVETEAYPGPHDPASHAAERIGRTARNASMFGAPGTAYVYRIYGLHWCLNVVTGAEGYPAAVLIRALEPLVGIEIMRRRRNGRPDRELASGPGRLTEALAITGAHDRRPLDRPSLLLLPGRPVDPRDTVAGPRIGVSRAADWPLRFYVRGSEWVSR